jgi:hypothetical protein
MHAGQPVAVVYLFFWGLFLLAHVAPLPSPGCIVEAMVSSSHFVATSYQESFVGIRIFVNGDFDHVS